MHENSLRLMAELIDRHCIECRTVLDVGSQDVNGTYRDLCEARGLTYTGADQTAGENVDKIMGTFTDTFDAVISGQTLEHCRDPFRLMQALCGHAEKFVIAIAPWQHKPHRYPIDCWRILPDGMRELVHSAGWHIAEVGFSEFDCYVVATPK